MDRRREDLKRRTIGGYTVDTIGPLVSFSSRHIHTPYAAFVDLARTKDKSVVKCVYILRTDHDLRSNRAKV